MLTDEELTTRLSAAFHESLPELTYAGPVPHVRRHGTDMRVIYQLTHNGYLVRRGQIITRTKKAWTVDKSVAERERRHARAATPAPKKKPGTAARPGSFSDQRRRQRQQTAEYLAQFDTEEPRTIPSPALGAYVRRGYLKPKGDGYLRTSKPFTVEVRHP